MEEEIITGDIYEVWNKLADVLACGCVYEDLSLRMVSTSSLVTIPVLKCKHDLAKENEVEIEFAKKFEDQKKRRKDLSERRKLKHPKEFGEEEPSFILPDENKQQLEEVHHQMSGRGHGMGF